jgi:hypothetical protein
VFLLLIEILFPQFQLQSIMLWYKVREFYKTHIVKRMEHHTLILEFGLFYHDDDDDNDVSRVRLCL